MQHALQIDRETGTTFWSDAIKKEMSVIPPAADILPDGYIGTRWISTNTLPHDL